VKSRRKKDGQAHNRCWTWGKKKRKKKKRADETMGGGLGQAVCRGSVRGNWPVSLLSAVEVDGCKRRAEDKKLSTGKRQ
jgi:hypothetical protein